MQQEKKVFPRVSENKTSGIDKTVPSHTISRDKSCGYYETLLNKTKSISTHFFFLVLTKCTNKF